MQSIEILIVIVSIQCRSRSALSRIPGRKASTDDRTWPLPVEIPHTLEYRCSRASPDNLNGQTRGTNKNRQIRDRRHAAKAGLTQNDKLRHTGTLKSGAKSETCHAAILLTMNAKRLFVVLGLEHFTATIKAIRADMVTHVRFPGSRLDSQLRRNQEIVRAMHAALGWGLLILLNSHDNS
jgi:hypothetical protein